MKRFKLWFAIGLSIGLFVIFTAPGNTQSGNMSDVTLPMPVPTDTSPPPKTNPEPPRNNNNNNPPKNNSGNPPRNNSGGGNRPSGNNNGNQSGANPIPGDTGGNGAGNSPVGNSPPTGNTGGNNTPTTNNTGGNNTPTTNNTGGNNTPTTNNTGNTGNTGSNNNTGNNTSNTNTGNRTGNTTGNKPGDNSQQNGETVDENQQDTAQEPTDSQETDIKKPDAEQTDRQTTGRERTARESNQEETEAEKPASAESEQEEAEAEKPTSEQEESEAKKPDSDEEQKTDRDNQPAQASSTVDRSAYDAQLQQATPVQAVQLQEEFQAVEIQNYLGVQLYGNNPPPEQISASLSDLDRITGKKSALIYVSSVDDELIVFTVFPSAENVSGKPAKNERIYAAKQNDDDDEEFTVLHKASISREQLIDNVKNFQNEISDEFKIGGQGYLPYSQQLYQWIIAPIKDQLKANGIETLVFTLDNGLRGLPIAALHDGNQFLIEQYALAVVPSFGLTDISYVDVRKSPILAMGASEFSDKVPLPAVPIELQTAIENPRRGEKFLNRDFTIANFKSENQKERFAIIHLGTHAEFQPGDRSQSYIQFFDNRLSMSELIQLSDELGWSSASNYPVELLVLSACQTALGDNDAELGFAGLAVAAGVKSVLASLWNVSDLGTLGLMSQFYQSYDLSANKSEALRQAQLAMLKGGVKVKDGKMILANGETIALPPEFPKGTLALSHPYYWAAFTLIGNWN